MQKCPQKRGTSLWNSSKTWRTPYACADYVISRAGSNTVFELLALKKPALLVPLENKRSRGDQAENAAYFSERGLCRVLHEKELSPDTLLSELEKLVQDESLKSALARRRMRDGNDAILAALLAAR